MPAVPRKNFRLPMLKARYPHLPNARSTRERGNDFKGWAIYTYGGTRVVEGETLAGWGALHDFTMEELISCWVLSSPPRLILPSQVPELTPTTPLK